LEIRFFESGGINTSNRDVVKATTHLGARGAMDGGPQTYRILKFVAGSFGIKSVLLAEGSILDPCHEILK
jgi:hypothetical protein